MLEFPRIVFFGTPEFAAVSLARILREGFSVAAVVTAPDKPAGRGLKEHMPAVKETALAHGIPVLQPASLKDPAFLDRLAALKPDLQVVIAFRMLPKQVWSLPPLGTFNLHASLLPQYRGAAPINWAVINGEAETGVTTFFLNEHIDTGRIILQEKVAIGPEESAGELHDRLMVAGSEAVVRTIRRIMDHGVEGTAQDQMIGRETALKPAPKIFKEDCRINWDQEAGKICSFIRGLSPYPGAWSELVTGDGTLQSYKVFRAHPEPGPGGHMAGVIVTDGKTSLKVACRDGYVNVDVIQMAGRKVMNSGDFLRGFGRIFTETRDNKPF